LFALCEETDAQRAKRRKAEDRAERGLNATEAAKEELNEQAEAAKAKLRAVGAKGWKALRRGSAGVLVNMAAAAADFKDSMWKDDAI